MKAPPNPTFHGKLYGNAKTCGSAQILEKKLKNLNRKRLIEFRFKISIVLQGATTKKLQYGEKVKKCGEGGTRTPGALPHT
jgi:hypothetical protein